MDVTVDELISMISHSSSPIIIIEGSDDAIVYRRLEEIFLDHGLTVQPAGCRDSVVEIFERRSEITTSAKVLFFVDSDSWILSGVPERYDHYDLIKTDGYSIENDVYVCGGLERYLTNAESIAFQVELQTFLRWYAYAVERFLGGMAEPISTHPNRVLDDEGFKLEIEPHLTSALYPEDRYDAILAEYRKILRGKSLLALLVRQLSKAGRKPKHHGLTLLETASLVGTPYMDSLSQRVRERLEI